MNLPSFVDNTHNSSQMSEDHAAYCVRPLPPDSGGIRLLRLLPSLIEDEPLQGQLIDYPLIGSGNRYHHYDALSYVWGSVDYLKSIAIDDCTLSITTNLHDALLSLRNHSFERVIWIDAICINQSDDLEKEGQIRIMADIYLRAHCVVVWLGKSADESDQAMETIRLFGLRIIAKQPSGDPSEKASEKASEETNNKAYQAEGYANGDAREAVLALLKRPWFRRIWVSCSF
jgi:hypothetical protein